KNALTKTYQGSKTYLTYLKKLMEVENPAYFIEKDYAGYGATAPEGFYTSEDIKSINLIEKDAVTNLTISFKNPSDDAGF
ncbi:MAG TPA: hypothetical protein PK771_02835, partial [Spirochaetota bacterium]|nr:hypothetical protein [Spirochaetota bacterium]